eukprot:gene6720-10885_t
MSMKRSAAQVEVQLTQPKIQELEYKFSEKHLTQTKTITESTKDYFEKKEKEITSNIIFPPEIISEIGSYLENQHPLMRVCVAWTTVMFPIHFEKRKKLENEFSWRFDVVGRYLGKKENRKLKKKYNTNPLLSKLPKEGKFYQRNPEAIIRAVVIDKKKYSTSKYIRYYNSVDLAFDDSVDYDIILLESGVHRLSERFIHKSLEFIGNGDNVKLSMTENINCSNISFFNLHISIFKYGPFQNQDYFEYLTEIVPDSHTYDNDIPMIKFELDSPISTNSTSSGTENSYLDFNHCVLDFGYRKGFHLEHYSFLHAFDCDFINFLQYAILSDLQSFVIEECRFIKHENNTDINFRDKNEILKTFKYRGTNFDVVSDDSQSLVCPAICLRVREFENEELSKYHHDFIYSVKYCEFDTSYLVGAISSYRSCMDISSGNFQLVDMLINKIPNLFVVLYRATKNIDLLGEPISNEITKNLARFPTNVGEFWKFDSLISGCFTVPFVKSPNWKTKNTTLLCCICGSKTIPMIRYSSYLFPNYSNELFQLNVCENNHVSFFEKCIQFEYDSVAKDISLNILKNWEELLFQEGTILSNVDDSFPPMKITKSVSPKYVPSNVYYSPSPINFD